MSAEEGGTDSVVEMDSKIVLTLGVSNTVQSTEFLGISVVSTVVSVVAVVVVAVVVVAVIVVAVLAIGVLEFVCVVPFDLTNAVFRLFAVDIFKLEVFNS